MESQASSQSVRSTRKQSVTTTVVQRGGSGHVGLLTPQLANRQPKNAPGTSFCN